MKPLRNVRHLALYQQDTCPFCLITQMEISKTDLEIELRNIQFHAPFRQELIAQGGKRQVPCLRIERNNGQVDWLYESRDIIAWVKAFAHQANTAA